MSDEGYFSIEQAYSIDQLEDRLTDANISRVRLVLADDRKITGDAVRIRDGVAHLYSDDRVGHEVQMMKINKLILYKEIPAADRRTDFFIPFLFFAGIGVGRAINNEDPRDALWGTLIGIGISMPKLLKKHREDEMILNLLNGQKIKPGPLLIR